MWKRNQLDQSAGPTDPGVIHDPLYGAIGLTETARQLIDTPGFQRLRRIKQLGMASWVYPSAVHTRFEHSLGVFHTARVAIDQLEERGELQGVTEDQKALVMLAALIHDTGHHPGAHLLEEYGYPGADHEEAGEKWFMGGAIGDILRQTGIPDAPRRVARLVQGRSDNPLGGLITGACDVDKVDYIQRDAYHCGLPVMFERERLLYCMTMVENPETGKPELGLKEKGLVNFEQLLYAKFNLFRSVYFHRTVRSATVMMRELVVQALETGLLEAEELETWTDEELFILLRSRVAEADEQGRRYEHIIEMTDRILNRRLYKEAASLPLSSAPDITPSEGAEIEAFVADKIGLPEEQVLLDIPSKPTMLSTDILVRRKNGEVVNASNLGPDDGFALNQYAESFYHASGRWTLFTAERTHLPNDKLEELVHEALREQRDLPGIPQP